MLNAMRALALLDLNRRFGTQDQPLSELRKTHAGELAPLLVEAADKIAKVYLLQADPADPDVVRVWGEALTEEKAGLLPFNRPSGARSATIGPVFKRSWTPNKAPKYSPSDKTLNNTDAAFTSLAKGDTLWASQFAEVRLVLFAIRKLEGKPRKRRNRRNFLR